MLRISNRHYVFHLFNKKNFEWKGGRKRKRERERKRNGKRGKRKEERRRKRKKSEVRGLNKDGRWDEKKGRGYFDSTFFLLNIKTFPQPPYSRHLAPCDFCLFPKLRGCRYEKIEEMKEAVTKVIDTLTQKDFHGAFQKLLERYKCIAAGGDYFEGDLSFMCVLSIKVPIRKAWKLI